MHQGSVDLKTGNVPLRLDGGYVVHFEGRNAQGAALVRFARSLQGPLLGFRDARELHDYIAHLPAHVSVIDRADVQEWLEMRMAETGA